MNKFVQVFVSPNAMIDGVRGKLDFWTPIIAIFSLHIVVAVLHVTLVDHGYYFADMIRAQSSWMSQEQIEGTQQSLRQGDSAMGPTAMIVFARTSSLVAYLFSLFISAGYLALVARVFGRTIGFLHWLSVVSWVSVIGSLSLLASAVAILAAPEGRLGFLEANPISLSNFLGREFEMISVAQFDVTNAWRWALLCLAYKRWTSVSWILSILVVLAPVSLLYSIAVMISP